MKVTEHLSPQTQTIEKTKNNATSQRPTSDRGGTQAPTSHSSNVEISDAAILMRQASELAKSAPDVRADKVAALKAQVQNGTYRIDAKAIADKLVDEHLGADFGKNNL